jgi:excisionase family DNA binding protein
MSEQLLLTIPVVAQRLSLSRAAVYRLITRGDLVAVRIGRARRVEAREVERFVAHLNVEPANDGH